MSAFGFVQGTKYKITGYKDILNKKALLRVRKRLTALPRRYLRWMGAPTLDGYPLSTGR